MRHLIEHFPCVVIADFLARSLSRSAKKASQPISNKIAELTSAVRHTPRRKAARCRRFSASDRLAVRSAYFYLLGEWEKAIKDASRAIELEPGYSLAYKLRALAENELGCVEDAIKDLKRFFILEPDGADRRRLEEVLHRLQLPSQPRNVCGWLSQFLGGR